MIGTSSGANSTPRSPRATMTPSLAVKMEFRFSMACGFSSFASTGISALARASKALTRRTSLALRTNGDGHIVHSQLDAELQVLLIFRSERLDAEVHAGQVDPLVFREPAPVDDLGFNVSFECAQDAQLDQPIVEKDRVALADVSRQTRVADADPLAGTVDVFRSQQQLLSRSPAGRTCAGAVRCGSWDRKGLAAELRAALLSPMPGARGAP